MGSLSESFPQPHAVNFHPCQIVCLEHAATRLYAEVIQVVEGRSICWVRPLLLSAVSIDAVVGDCHTFEPTQWHDLRNGSHLLLPSVLFRAAFDTEVMPLLTFLYATESLPEADRIDRVLQQRLSQFVQQVWQAHPDLFQLP